MMKAGYLLSTKGLTTLLACHFLAMTTANLPASASPAEAKIAAETPSSAASKTFFDPHPDDREADRVIETVQAITDALSKRNFVKMATYMDEGCSTFDESTGKLVAGRDTVIADVKRKVSNDPANPITFSIDRPFAKVTGDTAVVNFVLVKEVGGSHPVRFESHCTDIFVKRNGAWKKLHYRGDDWKPAAVEH